MVLKVKQELEKKKVKQELDFQRKEGLVILSWGIYKRFKDQKCSMGFPSGSDGKEFTCNVRDLGSIPGLERSLRERNVYSLQYFCLEISMDEEPGKLQSMGWQRVGLLSVFH